MLCCLCKQTPDALPKSTTPVPAPSKPPKMDDDDDDKLGTQQSGKANECGMRSKSHTKMEGGPMDGEKMMMDGSRGGQQMLIAREIPSPRFWPIF